MFEGLNVHRTGLDSARYRYKDQLKIGNRRKKLRERLEPSTMEAAIRGRAEKGLYGSWALIFDLSNMVNSYPSAFRATRPLKPTNSNIKTSKGEKSHLSTQGPNARLNIEWWD